MLIIEATVLGFAPSYGLLVAFRSRLQTVVSMGSTCRSRRFPCCVLVVCETKQFRMFGRKLQTRGSWDDLETREWEGEGMSKSTDEGRSQTVRA